MIAYIGPRFPMTLILPFPISESSPGTILCASMWTEKGLVCSCMLIMLAGSPWHS